MYRDRDLLDLAKGEKCLLNISPKCLWDEGSTTVACHSNFWQHNKGMGIKAEDCYSVWGCYFCHKMLDQEYLSELAKQKAFLDALAKQVHEWQLIADNPCLKPWKVEAAKKALQYLGEKDGTTWGNPADPAAWGDKHPY